MFWLSFEHCGRADGWCGYCYSNRKGRSGFRGHVAPDRAGLSVRESLALERRIMERRNTTREGQAAARKVAPEDVGMGKLPCLFEFLFAETFSDGSPRHPGSLTIFTQDGRIKACLNDKAEGEAGFVTL